MGLTRGSLTLPRMNAHRLVIIAAALTTIVAAALATALATFSGQALPRAVRHDLGHATGTTLSISGSVNASQVARYDSILPSQIKSALGGSPFTLYQASWSDPLGFVPGALPATPAAAAGSGAAANTPIAEAAALGDITGQAQLVSGRWPGTPVRGQPIPAALPATAATVLHVTVGDVLRMRDRITEGYVQFTITGLYRARQVSSPYWNLSLVAPSGSSTASGFTTFGPLTVPPAAFAQGLAVSQGTWLAEPQTASIPAGRLTAVAGNVTNLRTTLQNAQQLPSLTLVTSLPGVLDGTASDLDVARSLLAICAVLLFLLAGAALLAAARLLAGQREGESAMLAARGATRGQLIRMTAAEAIPLCVFSSAAGGVLGVLVARLAAGTGPTGNAWLAAVAVAAGAIVIMLIPALSTMAPGAARARRGRQAAISGVTRAGADLALVVLAVLAGWQLRHYSAVSAGANGNFGVDPVVVIAPALALAGGTVLALRLLPAGGKAGDRLAARGRRLTAALASWQISRQPIRQGGAALLIVLAVATGTLALSQRQSWTRSDHDQAAFSAGADVQVDTSQPLSAAQAAALVRLPGVQHAMPVATFLQTSDNSEVLALGSGQAANVALLRADQSPVAPAALFGRIRPAGPPPGVTLPGHAPEVQLTARLGPASLGLAPVTVNVSVEDADSNVYQLDAGTLPADGQDHTLTVNLANQVGGSAPGGAIYPLRLTSVSLDYTMPGKRPRGPATFTVAGFSAGPGTSEVPGRALGAWSAAGSSVELAGVRQTAGTDGPSAPPAVTAKAASGTGLSVTLDPGFGLAANPAGAPPSSVDGELTLTGTPPVTTLPAIATQRFLAATSSSVGSIVQADVNGAVLSVKIVGEVTTFPTVSLGGGALIVDLGSLQNVLTSGSLAAAQPDEWWLATSGGTGGPGPAGLAAGLPPGSDITSAAAVASGLLTDPLSTVPQQALLVVTIAAAVLAITGFCVSIAAGVRQRRAENALLAALGVPPRSAAGQLCLEKLMLSLPSAAAGLVLGVVLAELLVPAITLTSSATTPVPPVLIQFGWAQTLPLALAVAVLPVLAAALTVARRPDAAAALRAAEAA
jgi:FtsX-like permease family